MKAMQVQEAPNGLTLHPAQVSQPTPCKTDVLIRVHAAGIIPTELQWEPTTQTKTGARRSDAIPSHEFSGVIAGRGDPADDFNNGQPVYGMNDWYADGALAEFCLTQPSSIAPKPLTLSWEEAATVPISALTAWQGLFDHARLQPKEKILIHGGSGGVGTFAISGSLPKPNGRMVTIVPEPPSNDPRAKKIFFIVEPIQRQLVEIGELLDAGSLKTFVNAILPLEDAAKAYTKPLPHELGYGKIVITIPNGGQTS